MIAIFFSILSRYRPNEQSTSSQALLNGAADRREVQVELMTQLDLSSNCMLLG